MAKIGINLATGSIQHNETIVGIDLGTTNSLVAIIHPDNRKPIALKEVDGFSLVPSVVYFDEYDQPQVGHKAMAQLLTSPERTIYSAKRLMGKSFQDLEKHQSHLAYKIIDEENDALVKVQVGQKFYNPIDLSAMILRELKNRAEHLLKTPVLKAVITVPAYFNDTQRQATRDAGKLAGLDVLRIINEPTAASLAYGLDQGKGTPKNIAVYDLGGGTFDISILHLEDGIFEVLSTHGDTYLGGDDMDNAVVEYWQKKVHKSVGQWPLKWLAEKAKKHLSLQEKFEEEIEGVVFSIDKTTFENLITPIVERTLFSCQAALKDAGLNTGQIDEVVMVGGSTRIPFIKSAVSEFFGKKVHDHLNPDEVVAIGAAVQADILAGNNPDVLLIDVTPLSLGIETMGGLMDVLIPRNSKIPTSATRQYTTQKDGQAGMRISVFQGERDLVKDNRKLAEFHLTAIPGMPAGLAKVEISFMINADGILKVSAVELRSGVKQAIEVLPQFGLSDDEVEKRLQSALENAKTDIMARAITEARTEAEQMIATTEKFIEKYQEHLTEDELHSTKQQLRLLQNTLRSEDKNNIQEQTEKLNEISRPYAERVMESALKSVMKGKKIL